MDPKDVSTVDSLLLRIAELQAELARERAEMASAADILNTWCREARVKEVQEPLHLRKGIDRLWGHVSAKLASARAGEDAWKRSCKEIEAAARRASKAWRSQPAMMSIRRTDWPEAMDALCALIDSPLALAPPAGETPCCDDPECHGNRKE